MDSKQTFVKVKARMQIRGPLLARNLERKKKKKKNLGKKKKALADCYSRMRTVLTSKKIGAVEGLDGYRTLSRSKILLQTKGRNTWRRRGRVSGQGGKRTRWEHPFGRKNRCLGAGIVLTSPPTQHPPTTKKKNRLGCFNT